MPDAFEIQNSTLDWLSVVSALLRRCTEVGRSWSLSLPDVPARDPSCHNDVRSVARLSRSF